MRKIIVHMFLTLDGVMKLLVDPTKTLLMTSNMVVGLRRILPKLTKRRVRSWQNI